MKLKHLPVILIGVLVFSACKENSPKDPTKGKSEQADDSFDYLVEEFADIKILRYKIPGWKNLTLKQKKYAYYLVQAGLEGRDILWDQNYKYNLSIRKALEHIYTAYQGDKDTEDWKAFVTYLKQVWFANGIHHHYSNNKFKPQFSEAYLKTLLRATQTDLNGEALAVIFNDKDAKKVNLDESKGLISGSAVNFYQGDITAQEVDQHYESMTSADPQKPLSFGLNSTLVKENGKLEDRVWKSGGLYGAAIDKIIYWLEKAQEVAENEQQAKALGLLIKFYQTGDLAVWNAYSIEWTKATEGDIDYINGFIEVYEDPKGYKATFESVVQITDFEMSEK